MGHAYSILVGKAAGKKSRRRWKRGIILKWILGKYGWKVWFGILRLRIQALDGLLQTRCTFSGFTKGEKFLDKSYILSAFRERLCSMQLVSSRLAIWLRCESSKTNWT